MTHDEFMNNYGGYLEHKWVTSKDRLKAEAQKRREKEYNAEYYRKHRLQILAQQRARLGAGTNKSLSTFGEAIGNSINRIRQQNTLNKRTPFDVAASEAQAEARNRIRQQNTLNKRTPFDVAASEAQAEARNRIRQQNTLNKRTPFDVAASEAQAEAARNNAAYNKSLESKIAKNLSRASKKFADATLYVNTAVSKKIADAIPYTNAAKQKAIDIYNDTSTKINKAKKSVQNILNRYFG